MVDTPPKPAPSSMDQKLIRRVASSMFRADLRDSAEKKTPDERKAAWALQKTDYVKRARKLYRALEREGVNLTLQEEATI
ncbi:hypothetical protein LL251_20455 [Sphingobium naphthae]|nr:hypothetical protein [Sphingobium naphthae]